jgi:hypothetical protein
MMQRIVRRVVIVLFGPAALGLAGWAAWPASSSSRPTWTAEYDVSSRPPEAIPPGTIIDRGAPAGWSHLVVKSLPRVRESERPKIRATTAKYAEWMFTAFVADVRAEGGRNRICNVALGLGCEVEGQHTIITPESGAECGVELGWITRSILSTAYERQQKSSMVVFQGPTAWLVDTPVWFHRNGKHTLHRFRYLLLADGPGGPLDVVVWTVGPNGELDDPPTAVRLKPNTIDEAELVVDKSEFMLGVPSEAAFAVDRLPPGRPIGELPAELRPLAGQSRFTADEAAALEAGIRRILVD